MSVVSTVIPFPRFQPPIPDSLEKLGVPEILVQDLVLRRVFIERTSTLASLARALKLAPSVVETVFRQMRHRQLVEVLGMVGNDYTFALSGQGRQLAQERFQMTHYAGACPVSLADYHAGVKAQAARVEVNREKLRRALSDLVLPDALLDQLGPAIISQAPLFLYGSTGNGKTSLAERLVRLYEDDVLIPYAVEVDSQIIILYDPVVHQRVEEDEEADRDVDPRWVRCKRPCILAGGELVPSMLELRMDEATGTYAAPIQMKANNGILVIDDFGRQLIPPRDLLNRWIVPLDRRVDYLMLRYGVKFQIPFEMMVVFATNLDPSALADEAFLRRIRNKILVEEISAEIFDEILRRCAASLGIPYQQEQAEYLRALILRDGRTVLRACYPGDICRILLCISRYEGRKPEMRAADLERAVALYFARSEGAI
ncbi:MAG: AAA family ATPase [Bryobacterales bacterium]|nr:AAA family ATPase [Bryobacteraceae bacterium]MDW8353173.1 AAA family ATPase [Bryobacterales bacterium]